MKKLWKKITTGPSTFFVLPEDSRHFVLHEKPSVEDFNKLLKRYKHSYIETIEGGLPLFTEPCPLDMSDVMELPSGSYIFSEGTMDLPDRLEPITFRNDSIV